MRLLCLILVLCFLLGCSYGSGSTRAVDDMPTVAVTGAPVGSTLYVDGIEFGIASQFTTSTPVEVIPGVHDIEIRQGAEVLHSQKIYSGTGSMNVVSLGGSD